MTARFDGASAAAGFSTMSRMRTRLSPAGSARAQGCAAKGGSPEYRYCYSLVLVQVLHEGHAAYSTYGDSVGTRPCSQTNVGEAAEVLFRAKMRQQAFKQASDHLGPFKNSSDSTVRLITQAVASNVVGHENAAQDAQIVCRYLLDGGLPGTGNSNSQVADSVAKVRVALHAAGELLTLAAAELSNALARANPRDRTSRVLTITAPQRASLLKSLQESFGAELENAAPSTDFAKAAASLYKFLSDPALPAVGG